MNKRKLVTDRQGLVQYQDGRSTLRLLSDRLERIRMGAVRRVLPHEREDIHRSQTNSPNANEN